MIVTIEPGQLVEVLSNASFTIRFRSPWTAEELAVAASIMVDYNSPSHSTGQFEGVAEGADVLLRVTPATFGTQYGLWELNPAVTFGADVRRFVFAIPMNVLSNSVSRYSRLHSYPIQ